MKKIWRSIGIQIFLLGLILGPAGSMAADFELFWDPNCDLDAALEGYFIYYKANASVVGNPSGATEIYIPVLADGFERTAPGYQIDNLLNNVRYCFAVTALYDDVESDMSNEICGINGAYAPEPDSEPEPDPGPEPDLEPEPEPEPDQQPFPGIDPNPGPGIDPGVTNLLRDNSSGGCFIAELE